MPTDEMIDRIGTCATAWADEFLRHATAEFLRHAAAPSPRTVAEWFAAAIEAGRRDANAS